MENKDSITYRKIIRLDSRYITTVLVTELAYLLEFEDHSLIHRDDGPAKTTMYGDDKFVQEWFLFGYKHRLDGPAVIRDFHSNLVDKYEWWIDGARLNEEKERLLNTWYENQL